MDQPTDNALYLRKWAEDIRAHSGKSVDADRLEDIADEIDRLRSMLADVTTAHGVLERYCNRDTLAQVEAVWETKRTTGKFPFED
jgi:hypothetical protein